ncbi:hypothetical protein V6N13_012991 [Hibiscus sabdariffa]|uniref:RNase H type-1 domain-containing protein n=1 Tax=Hibiscus sabdariffa TaxID=183260 RepID=A0ABR2SH27_9ROSI
MASVSSYFSGDAKPKKRSTPKASLWSPKNSGILYSSKSVCCSCSTSSSPRVVHEPQCGLRKSKRVTKDGVCFLIPPITTPIKWCFWKKPPTGCIKLNTDGSVLPGSSAFGGLLRDCDGDPICAYVTKSLEDNVFLVELWAILRGLVLALNLGFTTLWVESDSSTVVDAINEKQPHDSKAGYYLSQIWELLDGFEDCLITHSWREANKAADFLSKMRLTEDDAVLSPTDFPDTLRSIIKDDA